MGNLEDKLREILEDWYPGTQYEEVIPKLKQAFADEGYLKHPVDVQTSRDPLMWDRDRLLTGQEWYDRFRREYRALSPISYAKDQYAKMAAKKASGIDNG